MVELSSFTMGFAWKINDARITRIKKTRDTLAGNRIRDFKTLWSRYREKTNRQWEKNRAQDTHMELWGVAEKGEQFTVKGKSIKWMELEKWGTLGMRTLYSCLTLSSNSTSHQKELMSGAKLRTSYNENIFLILGMEQHL